MLLVASPRWAQACNGQGRTLRPQKECLFCRATGTVSAGIGGLRNVSRVPIPSPRYAYPLIPRPFYRPRPLLVLVSLIVRVLADRPPGTADAFSYPQRECPACDGAW